MTILLLDLSFPRSNSVGVALERWAALVFRRHAPKVISSLRVHVSVCERIRNFHSRLVRLVHLLLLQAGIAAAQASVESNSFGKVRDA